MHAVPTIVDIVGTVFRRRSVLHVAPAPVRRPIAPDAGRSVGGLLDTRLDDISAGLDAATGGASLCSVSRTAGSVPTAKYLEGRISAVVEVRRAVRRGGRIGNVVAAGLATWQTELDRVASGGSGSDWIAYRAGGVDELRDLIDELRDIRSS